MKEMKSLTSSQVRWESDEPKRAYKEESFPHTMLMISENGAVKVAQV